MIHTGYADGCTPEVKPCEYCGEDEQVVEYEDLTFCSTDCLVRWLFDNDLVKKIA
ncbi:hypothetical protein [Lysinibacillus sp. 54212]|uniref:hypothetical protein n=1 Tax=Lysinibacillus sp. 54212 TaxID=3119829 RepID=UPI002FC61086